MTAMARAGGRNRLAPACLLLVVFGVGMLTLPAQSYKSDPVVWQEEARALILHQRLSLDLSELMALQNSFGKPIVQNPRNGQWYSRYGIFNSLLAAIPLSAEKWFTGELPPLDSPMRVVFLGVFSVMLSGGIAAALFSITGYYTHNLPARCIFVLLAFYATYLWNYLRCPMSESTQLLLFACCYLSFLRFKNLPQPLEKRSRTDIYLGWLALLALCETRVTYLLLLPLFAWVLVKAGGGHAQSGDTSSHPVPPPQAGYEIAGYSRRFILPAVVAPIVLIMSIQAMMQTMKFGRPWDTGYSQSSEHPVAHTMLSATEDFLWGGQGSVFLHFPLLVLGALGARKFIRRYPCDSIFLLGSLLIAYLLVAPAYGPWRGEWAYGPRYFIFILPLLALPALYPLAWMCVRPFTPLRMTMVAACAAVSVFFIAAQMQVNRLDYFFKYTIDVGDSPGVPEAIRTYFSRTNFAQINWDHLHCSGHWQRLPYYTEMEKHATRAGSMQRWKKFVEWEVSRSNLYWFPDDTHW